MHNHVRTYHRDFAIACKHHREGSYLTFAGEVGIDDFDYLQRTWDAAKEAVESLDDDLALVEAHSRNIEGRGDARENRLIVLLELIEVARENGYLSGIHITVRDLALRTGLGRGSVGRALEYLDENEFIARSGNDIELVVHIEEVHTYSDTFRHLSFADDMVILRSRGIVTVGTFVKMVEAKEVEITSELGHSLLDRGYITSDVYNSLFTPVESVNYVPVRSPSQGHEVFSPLGLRPIAGRVYDSLSQTPMTIAALADAAGVPFRTVHAKLDELIEAGLAERVKGGVVKTDKSLDAVAIDLDIETKKANQAAKVERERTANANNLLKMVGVSCLYTAISPTHVRDNHGRTETLKAVLARHNSDLRAKVKAQMAQGATPVLA